MLALTTATDQSSNSQNQVAGTSAVMKKAHTVSHEDYEADVQTFDGLFCIRESIAEETKSTSTINAFDQTTLSLSACETTPK